MELNHEFDVAVPPAETWTVLTDLERIAPCLPGANLQEVEGDEYRGTVKVKVGPITAQYKGTASFSQLDETAGRAVLLAKGRDTKGQGNASATITADLTETDSGTHVALRTDLKISGKVAQFGRGAIADVSGKLMAQFVESLERKVLYREHEATDEPAAEPGKKAAGAEPEAPTEATTSAAADERPEASAPKPQLRLIDSPEAEPIDLLATAGGSGVARGFALGLLFAGAVGLLIVLCGRHHDRAIRRLAADQSG